ncbi:uncharacterized protein TNCV_479201 [Trichonephila clavipes]|nr:uncharacterized protein TNCV_479201 [Trichonephila clavipes]
MIQHGIPYYRPEPINFISCEKSLDLDRCEQKYCDTINRNSDTLQFDLFQSQKHIENGSRFSRWPGWLSGVMVTRSWLEGSWVAWWLEHRTPDRKAWVRCPMPPNTLRVHTEYVLVKSVGPKVLWAESPVQGTGEYFPPLQFHGKIVEKITVDFQKRILFSDEAHFWLNGYVNKPNCRIWSEADPQVYVETPLHPEKLTVWCAL